MKTGRLLWWLLAGARGSANRAKIIISLHEMPSNANQVAQLLNLNYKTIRHHLDILAKHEILTTEGEGCGMVYFRNNTNMYVHSAIPAHPGHEVYDSGRCV